MRSPEEPATHPSPTPLQPTVLAIQIGGFMGDSYAVRLEHGELLWKHLTQGFEPHRAKAVVPADGDWRAFGDALDRLGAWDWPAEFKLPEGEMVLDGTHWSAEIEWGDQRLLTGGTNAYPPGGQVDDAESHDFCEFCGAVSRLVGGLEFR